MAKDLLNRKMVSGAALAALLLSGWTAPSSAAPIDDAINKAGKQRMITQRLMKDYAMIGMNLDLGNPDADLKKFVQQFDSILADLDKYSSEQKIRASLADIRQQWVPLKKVLQDVPDKSRAAKLQRDLDALLAACQKNTRLMAELSGNQRGEIVDLAGRQRMLSQRMAALYMLKAWKVDDLDFSGKLSQSMDEFSSAHARLEASPLTTTEIRAILARVKKSYAWFEMMGRSKSGRVIPSLINKSANNILADMDKVTAMYAATKK
ncbi:type IV pili methyl-accepting chemotaxis transducer N-terminal domain-containing protein [Thiolapillus sp.]